MMTAQGSTQQQAGSAARYYAFRLTPGEDLLRGMRKFVDGHDLRAVAVVTCVGSLTRANLRFANAEKWVEKTGHFEIVSLCGTMDEETEHLHIAISDGEGNCIGANLGEGSIVYTTAEVVLAELTELEFERAYCQRSGYDELSVKARRSSVED